MIEDGTVPARASGDEAAHRAILDELEQVSLGGGKSSARV
jgi:hypothetical protein